MLVGCGEPIRIKRQFRHRHAPVVERFRQLWGMISKADFRQPGGQRGIDVLTGVTFRMTAQRGVGVVIGQLGNHRESG